jgi:hypothetical protein
LKFARNIEELGINFNRQRIQSTGGIGYCHTDMQKPLKKKKGTEKKPIAANRHGKIAKTKKGEVTCLEIPS